MPVEETGDVTLSVSYPCFPCIPWLPCKAETTEHTESTEQTNLFFNANRYRLSAPFDLKNVDRLDPVLDGQRLARVDGY